MKFAFEEFHLWYQLALSLMAAGKVSEAEWLSAHGAEQSGASLQATCWGRNGAWEIYYLNLIRDYLFMYLFIFMPPSLSFCFLDHQSCNLQNEQMSNRVKCYINILYLRSRLFIITSVHGELS